MLRGGPGRRYRGCLLLQGPPPGWPLDRPGRERMHVVCVFRASAAYKSVRRRAGAARAGGIQTRPDRPKTVDAMDRKACREATAVWILQRLQAVGRVFQPISLPDGLLGHFRPIRSRAEGAALRVALSFAFGPASRPASGGAFAAASRLALRGAFSRAS
jgi:hypothetical protein